MDTILEALSCEPEKFVEAVTGLRTFRAARAGETASLSTPPAKIPEYFSALSPQHRVSAIVASVLTPAELGALHMLVRLRASGDAVVLRAGFGCGSFAERFRQHKRQTLLVEHGGGVGKAHITLVCTLVPSEFVTTISITLGIPDYTRSAAIQLDVLPGGQSKIQGLFPNSSEPNMWGILCTHRLVSGVGSYLLEVVDQINGALGIVQCDIPNDAAGKSFGIQEDAFNRVFRKELVTPTIRIRMSWLYWMCEGYSWYEKHGWLSRSFDAENKRKRLLVALTVPISEFYTETHWDQLREAMGYLLPTLASRVTLGQLWTTIRGALYQENPDVAVFFRKHPTFVEETTSRLLRPPYNCGLTFAVFRKYY